MSKYIIVTFYFHSTPLSPPLLPPINVVMNILKTLQIKLFIFYILCSILNTLLLFFSFLQVFVHIFQKDVLPYIMNAMDIYRVRRNT